MQVTLPVRWRCFRGIGERRTGRATIQATIGIGEDDVGASFMRSHHRRRLNSRQCGGEQRPPIAPFRCAMKIRTICSHTL